MRPGATGAWGLKLLVYEALLRLCLSQNPYVNTMYLCIFVHSQRNRALWEERFGNAQVLCEVRKCTMHTYCICVYWAYCVCIHSQTVHCGAVHCFYYEHVYVCVLLVVICVCACLFVCLCLCLCLCPCLCVREHHASVTSENWDALFYKLIKRNLNLRTLQSCTQLSSERDTPLSLPFIYSPFVPSQGARPDD